ncbi:MAG: hypothetical protein JNJ51_06105 [Methylobacillus glycogenes]|nr:hypothetical protein [Methylobacillus glycogenes]
MNTAIQEAFGKVGVQAKPKEQKPYSPYNQSAKAIKRVLNPLPAPETCRYCGDCVSIVTNDEVYGRIYGTYPWIYLCENDDCRAYVGMHPLTAIPLGVLADKELRDWRKKSKGNFLSMFPDGDSNDKVARTAAYQWLADKMGIPLEKCHFGWFEVEQCKQAAAAIAYENRCRNRATKPHSVRNQG